MKSKHLMLLGPFGRRVSEANNAHAVGQPGEESRSWAMLAAMRRTLSRVRRCAGEQNKLRHR
jgi:hypothetical protein